MHITTNKPSSFKDNGFYTLKNNEWIEKQRISGKVAAETLMMLEKLVNDKTNLSLIELNNLAEEFIIDNKCSPTFKGYKGHGNIPFPSGCCISVNRQLVHGIPTDYHLQDGDLVSFDLGATFEGVIADTAITCLYGEAKKPEHIKLLKAGKEALERGIEAARPGNRIGAIGHAIYKSAKNNGFNVITQYGGHGIDISEDGIGMPHTLPFVSNKANLEDGPLIQPNMCIAIEPLLTPGPNQTKVDADGWTVSAPDISCHMEHTIFIHKEWTEIMTKRNYI